MSAVMPQQVADDLDEMKVSAEMRNSSLRQVFKLDLSRETHVSGAVENADGWHPTRTGGALRAHVIVRIPVVLFDALYLVSKLLRGGR